MSFLYFALWIQLILFVFFSFQIKVNAYCLKGDIGLAADEAKHLYERVKALNLPVGLALSLQSGAICTWNGLNRRFPLSRKRETLLSKGDKSDNNPLLIRIYLPNVHVCWSLNDLSGMSLYLDKLSASTP